MTSVRGEDNIKQIPHNMTNRNDDDNDYVEQIKRRKREGIEIPLKENVQGKKNSTYLEYVKLFHSAFLIANIGGAQLSEGLSNSDVLKIVKMIDANALAIHLNPLQELIQPEGEPRFKGVLQKIANLVNEIEIPIIVKEVGSGISDDVAIRLENSGVQSINVAGSGGTSWAGIEK